jgi:hypothetical protein
MPKDDVTLLDEVTVTGTSPKFGEIEFSTTFGTGVVGIEGCTSLLRQAFVSASACGGVDLGKGGHVSIRAEGPSIPLPEFLAGGKLGDTFNPTASLEATTGGALYNQSFGPRVGVSTDGGVGVNTNGHDFQFTFTKSF